MSLWADKFRPRKLEQLDYHHELTQRLKQLAATDDFPHLLLYGASGSGRKTRLKALMYELYGAVAEKLTLNTKEYETPSKQKFHVHLISSPVHIEINPSDVGIYDRIVVQQLIKEMAQTQQLELKTEKKHPFKLVVINECHHLTKDAQNALRRTMERYMNNIRLILVGEGVSRIIDPIKSRCLCVRVECPTLDDCKQIMAKLPSKPSDSQVQDWYLKTNGNLRKMLLIAEANSVDPAHGAETDWEVAVKNVVKLICDDQSAARIQMVRTKLYELLSHAIPGDLILEKLLLGLLARVSKRKELVEAAALYDHRLQLGSKAIYHLEAFVIRAMQIIKGV